MSKYRRIGAASLQHRTSRAPSGADAEREAVVRSIARAGEFGLRTWFEYIQQARRDRARALGQEG
jgi:hypothetical protein